MGHPYDLFTDPEVNDEFLCPICHDVLKDAVVLDPCEHNFCRDCINQWRRTSNTCPVDRRPIRELKNPQRMYTNLLNGLQMKCPFSAAGCEEEFKLGDLQHHDERCDFNPENHKPCVGGCGAVLTQAKVKSGSHNCVQFLKKEHEKKERSLVLELGVARGALRQTENALKSKEEQLKLQSDVAQLLEERVKLKDGQLKENRVTIEGYQRMLASAGIPDAGTSRKRKSDAAAPETAKITIESVKNIDRRLQRRILRIVTDQVERKYPTTPLNCFSFRDAVRDALNDAEAEEGTPKPWSVNLGLRSALRDEGFELIAGSAMERLDLTVRDLKIVIWR